MSKMLTIKTLEKRVELLEKIVAQLQLRLSFAGEPHKNQEYSASLSDLLSDLVRHLKGRKK